MRRTAAVILSLAVALAVPGLAGARAAHGGHGIAARGGSVGVHGGMRGSGRIGPAFRRGPFRPFPRFPRFPHHFRPFFGFGVLVPFYPTYYDPYCDPDSLDYYPPWCYWW